MPMIARASDKTSNRAADYIVASGTSRTDYHPFDTRRTAAGRGRTGIQHLIADLAGHFVTIEPDEIGDTILASLRQVCEGLRIDHAILWRTHGDDLNVVADHFGSKHPLGPLPDPRALAVPPTAHNRRRDASPWSAAEDTSSPRRSCIGPGRRKSGAPGGGDDRSPRSRGNLRGPSA